VPRGASGGVTWLGLAAALLGAVLIGGVAALFVGQAGLTILAVSLGGVLGSPAGFGFGGELAGGLFLPTLSDGNRTPSASFLRRENPSAARHCLAEQRRGQLRLHGLRGIGRPGESGCWFDPKDPNKGGVKLSQESMMTLKSSSHGSPERLSSACRNADGCSRKDRCSPSAAEDRFVWLLRLRQSHPPIAMWIC
jgi:hypothetical protein